MLKRALVSITLLLLTVLAGAQEYIINQYRVRLDVDKSGGMRVAETIDVTFNIPRRGIFRFIPVDYETGKGTSRSIWLNDIKTVDEVGNFVTQKITREGRNVKIRLGDADVTFPGGTRKVYTISYTVRKMLNWFDENKDWTPTVQLYWNLTGDEWDTTINRASFEAHFPDDADVSKSRARLYVGSYGSRDFVEVNGAGSKTSARGAIALAKGQSNGSVADLNPREGITLVLDLPIETIPKPSQAEQIWDLVLTNLGFGIPILSLLAMPALWFKFGRDPDGGPMVVQFEPPDHLSGSEAGTLLDEKVDLRDISAGVITLAVGGYLTIIPKETGLVFKKRGADLEMTDKPAGSELGLFEAKLHKLLKAAGPLVTDSDLRENVAPSINDLRTTLYSSLIRHGYYRTSPETSRVSWGCGGTLLMIGLGFLTARLNPVGAILPSIVGSVIGALIVWAFSSGMPRRTKAGSIAQQRVKGFEEFIRRARGNEIEWQVKKHPDMALFEEYLPHAIAFGLAKEWGEAFEGILHEAPSWYASPYGTPFRPIYFASDIVSIGDSVGAAATTPPRSSGSSGGNSGFSSGGGFSGGGMGGGGGGSW